MVQPIRDFAKLYQVYEKFVQDGYDELFAKEICGLNNPVVFNLLVTLHEAAQCDLNYFSDRDKIFRRFQNQKYVQGNFFDKQTFCDDHVKRKVSSEFKPKKYLFSFNQVSF